MDILTLLWTVLTFVLGLVWSLVWFVLRDLISTVLWVVIVAWLVLSVRYRSFTAGVLGVRAYPRQADPRITLQKLPRSKHGSLSASIQRTSGYIVQGVCP